MSFALLLAVAVACQVDVDYTPKVNDRALLGAWNAASPDDTIQRAFCYASIDDAKAAIRAIGEAPADGGLSSTPDTYTPRAGTAVLIKQVVPIDVEVAGVKRSISALKVRILEGEFKGKELFTAPQSVFRQSGNDARAGIAKAQTKGQAQSQSVVEARKARRRAYNQREAAKATQEQIEYQRQLAAQEKAAKDYQAYVVKMGPIWAAEHANQIQQERNAIEAQRNKILKQQADNEAWLLWQLRSQSR